MRTETNSPYVFPTEFVFHVYVHELLHAPLNTCLFQPLPLSFIYIHNTHMHWGLLPAQLCLGIIWILRKPLNISSCRTILGVVKWCIHSKIISQHHLPRLWEKRSSEMFFPLRSQKLYMMHCKLIKRLSLL